MLKDKVVLITGAGRGIGRVVALLAAENHAKVIINYNRSEKEAAKVAEEIKNKGLEAMAMKADVSNENEVRAMFDSIRDKFDRLDVIVNNAGIMKGNMLMLTKTEEYDEINDINAKGTFLCMRYASKLMLKQKSGKIINLTSIIGTNGEKGYAAYSASKAAVIGMTLSAAKELGALGITVNAIAPGFIDTDMTSGLKEEIKQDIIKNIALKRIGKPEDVAKAILFLSSGQSDYITGQVIGVDGGQIM
ncbi:MAG: 3-oxoacyl-ACP reductase family protein [Candidatus Altiarchaeia archaeon]